MYGEQIIRIPQSSSADLYSMLKQIKIIKNSLFDQVIEDKVKNIDSVDVDYREIKWGVGVLIKVFIVTSNHVVARMKMLPNSKIRTCKHVDADEIIEIIDGDITNLLTEENYNKKSKIKIHKNELHSLYSKNGCEAIISWELK